MKRLSLLGLVTVLFISSAFAQGDPKKAVKVAKKKLSSFFLDQNKNFDDLLVAKKLIDFAAKDPEYGKMFKTNLIKGQVYNALVTGVTVKRVTNPDFKDPAPGAAQVAYEAFLKAYNAAEKKYQKSDALDGMAEALPNISNMGISAYKNGDFATAYKAFNTGLEIHKLLKEHKKKSPLDDPEQYQNQLYITGLAALNAKMYDKAGAMFKELRNSGFDKPELYDGIYKVYLAQKDTVAARKVLAEGRQKYPANKALMYSEINDYLQQGRTAELVDKLRTAIASDPKNLSLHATLGTVYDQLSQEARNAKQTDKAEEYLSLAKQSYENALKLSPENFEVTYSLGALYYNKAAAYSKDLKALSEDLSKAGLAKYDKVKKEMDDVFKQALPYFLKADKLNPKDRNTLIALKEIYARLNDLEKSKEYDQRLKALGDQ